MLLVTALFALSLLAALQRTSAGAMLLGFSLILFLGTRGMTRFVLPAVSVVAPPFCGSQTPFSFSDADPSIALPLA